MQLRTDLALEAREMIDEKRTGVLQKESKLPDGIHVDTEEKEYLTITRINVGSEEAEKAIGKKQGNYITLEIKDVELNTLDIHKEVSYTLSNHLNDFINPLYKKDPMVMIIGLGNRYITPDSLGPKVVEKIVVTRHIKENSELKSQLDTRLGNVCAVAPGVMGVTGIETGEIIKGLVEKASPDIIFVIDALAARRTSRINTTIQISDTGIVPGSGVGNHRMELSKETLDIPVVSIGVPTVVDALTLSRDLMEDIEGYEMDEEVIDFISRRCGGANMVVTPKNIDISIERMSTALSNAINLSVHKGFDFGDISEYLL